MINRELYMEQITPFIDKPFVKGKHSANPVFPPLKVLPSFA